MLLVPEFTWRVVANAATDIGATDLGNRSHNELPEIFARNRGFGGDWYLQTTDGWGRIDVRCLIETDDGAVLDVRYSGWVEATQKLKDAIASRRPTEYEDQLIRTVWRIETGDSRYQWLNHAVLIGEGRMQPGDKQGQLGMVHRVFRCG